jgi:hypothetical protein
MPAPMGKTRTWTDLNDNDEYGGLWVALDNCRYDQSTGKPVEGDVVDVDPDFSVLCQRMREGGRCSCAILFCDDSVRLEPHTTEYRASDHLV